MSMTYPECRKKMELRKTTLHFERGSFYADVENVAAYICPNCGTRSIPGNTAKEVSAAVEQLFKSAKRNKKPVFSGISFQKIGGY